MGETFRLNPQKHSPIIARMKPQFFPHDATWIGVMLLVIAALFLAAAVIGTVARMVMPERYAFEELRETTKESEEETPTEPTPV